MVRCLGVAMLALGHVSPASAAVTTVAETGFVVRLVAETTASAEEAWEALVTPSGWWSDDHTYSGDAANLTIDPRASGCFCESLPAPKDAPRQSRAGSVEHMRVIHADPGRFLRMSGGLGPLQSEAVQGTLTMTLKAQDGGTRILWEYVVGGQMRYKVDQIAGAVDLVLAQQLGHLATKLGLPQRMEVLHEESGEETATARRSDIPDTGEGR
ncbi:MAG TPA: SRPBCC family protein [Novosphingobium sp.]|nr:SRPBCC family protein [Novosphingobium sp.]